MVDQGQKTLFLHIGLPKTGTSALQVLFAKNAKTFYKKGLRYPGVSERVGSEELITSGNGAKIARQAFLEDGESAASSLTLLERALRAADRNVLLSSEYFASWGERQHQALKEYAAGFGYAVRVIAYLRDQADIVVTHYFQGLKRRPGYVDVRGDNFTEFAREYLKGHSYLDFEWLMGLLAKTYGASNVRVRSTKRGDLVDNSLICDVLDALGLVPDGDFDLNIPKVNPTPNQQEMYMRAVMGMFHPTVETSDAFLRVVSRIHAETHGDSNLQKENFFIDHKVVEEIRSKFSEGNALVCNEWFQGRAFHEVFEQKQYGIKREFNASTMDIDTVIAVFGGMLVEVLGRLERMERGRGMSPAEPELD